MFNKILNLTHIQLNREDIRNNINHIKLKMSDQVFSCLNLHLKIKILPFSVTNQPQPVLQQQPVIPQQQPVIQTNVQPQGQVFGPEFRYGFCDYCADQGQCWMNCCFGPGISSYQIAVAIDEESPCMWFCGVCWLGPLCLTFLRWDFKLILSFPLAGIQEVQSDWLD